MKIHHPSEIIQGKLYEACFSGSDDYLYMGCVNYDTKEKFLVIVVDEYDGEFLGITVTGNLNMPIWKNGFTLKD